MQELYNNIYSIGKEKQMQKNSKFNTFKRLLYGMLIILVVVLLIYIFLIIMGNKNNEDLIGKVTAFFQTFTIGIDTKISEVDYTILNENKKIEIEKSPGEIEVKQNSSNLKLETEKKEVETYAAPTSNSANSLYYNQLDQYGKIIYTKLKNESGYFLEGEHTFDFGYGFNDLLNTEGGDKILKQSFQYAINSLLFDYPELFFVNIENISLAIQKTEYNNKNTVYKVTIVNTDGSKFYIPGLYTKEEVNQRRQALYNEKNKILAKTSNMTSYEKIKYIHDYLIDNTEYDRTVSKRNIYNATGPLLDKTAVCEGYAKAFKFLMDGVKIPTIVVAGKGYDDAGRVERHAWNYVNLNNKWYLVDVTWDDPIIIGASGLTDEYRYKYFLVGRNTTQNSHIEDGNIVDTAKFKYPELSQNGY